MAAVWCYESLCGIQPVYDRPGFKHFILAPQPPPGMTWAQAEIQTVHGTITSRWERKNGRLVYAFTVPANTTATIRLPHDRKADGDTKGGNFIGVVDGAGGKNAVYEAVAGNHTLTVTE